MRVPPLQQNSHTRVIESLHFFATQLAPHAAKEDHPCWVAREVPLRLIPARFRSFLCTADTGFARAGTFLCVPNIWLVFFELTHLVS